LSEGTGCIFCGRSPQTKTHVFRRAWIERLMVPAPQPFEVVHASGDLTGAAREGTWPARDFDWAPGAACDPCNSGWMDKIDRAAERIIEPMVIGQRATIRAFQDQKAVATWVSQVVILMDQMQVSQAILPEMHRRFYEDQEPFEELVIWLARAPLRWSIEGWQRAWLIAPGAPVVGRVRPNMGLFTFRIVNLAVQALVPLDKTGLGFRVNRGENMRFLKQLWPSRYTPVSWPPRFTISEETLWDFAREFEPPDSEMGKWSKWQRLTG
jgi:hypothetical protein